MTAAAGIFPSLAHHWAVLKESWAIENERSRERAMREETQFLPAALEIIETPASPGLRILLLTLCGLVVVALAWACLGRLDVVAVASGKTLPAANVKVVQPLEIGVVRAIHVHDGQRVRAGDLLVELDPTIVGADEAQAARGLLAARIARVRNRALLAYLEGRPATFVAPEGTPADVATVQAQLVRTAIAEYEAQRASLLEQRAERNAELTGAQEEVRKVEGSLPFLDRQLDARRTLAEKGLNSKIQLWELEARHIELAQNLKIQKSAAAKATAAIASLNARLAELRETFAKGAVGELSEAEDEASLRAEEVTKSAKRKVFQQLRSPVDGTVQQLSIHTVGGVVQPAQALMVIVPKDSELVVEAAVLNRDIGFVRQGQPVRVKLEAYPFTDYGLMEGRVERLSQDAIQDEKLGLVYAARIRLVGTSLERNGRRLPIGPGMAVQAEIKTGNRRIIQYLLSPIAKAADEAGRER